MNGFYWKVIERALKKKSLTDWEREFCVDLHNRGEQYELTEKQTHILNQIGGRP